jgi:hypothetical protein
MRNRMLGALFLVTVLSVSFASAVNAQNLVANGSFDATVNGWTPLDSVNVGLSWSSDDAAGSASSGSLVADNSSSAPLDSGFAQCVSGLSGGTVYSFGVKMRIPSSNPAGSSSLQVQWNDAVNCTGNFLRAEIMESGIRDSWSSVSGSIAAPPGTQSALIFGQVDKTASGAGTYQTSFDDIFLETTQQTQNGTCVASATTLCIDDQPGDHRFRLTATWNDPSVAPGSGNGQAIALSSLGVSRGGIFWFFSSDNPEMLIKVLNGCGVNHSYWVFFSADTNVGFSVSVTDTLTNATRNYTNSLNNAAGPLQDTSAFPCL